MVSKKRKICCFSGKRGGFGAYVPLMQLIEKDPKLELQILLGDMHASKQFGNTAREANQYFPTVKLDIIKMGADRGDTPLIRTENLGMCLSNAVKILDKNKPDIVLVHGDRGEHLMVAFAALNLNIPVAHTQGGEVSGNIDDIQRHAITKLAHLHFPETKDATKRIKKIGEDTWRIKNVGSTYIDRISNKMYASLDQVSKKYGLEKNEKYFVTLFHPDTFVSRYDNYKYAKDIFKAIKPFGWRSFIIYPCSDPGYEGVLKAIQEIKNNPQFLVYKNIDNLDFLSLMENSQALIGNSSSALEEAPYLKLPAINIGRRQLDRDHEENMINAKPTAEDIKRKINYILTNKNFRNKLKKCGYRLGDGQAAQKIIKVLKEIKIDDKLLRKRMTY